jgi:hypothetical protein
MGELMVCARCERGFTEAEGVPILGGGLIQQTGIVGRVREKYSTGSSPALVSIA